MNMHWVCYVDHPLVQRPSFINPLNEVAIMSNSWRNLRTPFYVYGIDFSHLCYEDEDAPQIGVWIKPSSSARIDLGAARDQVKRQGQRIFGIVPEEPREAAVSLWWRIPETRPELLRMIAQNSGRTFVKVMIDHLPSLKPLIPVIDGIFKANAHASRVRRG